MSFVPSSEGSFSFKYEYTSRVFFPFTWPFSNQTNLSFAENFVSTKSNISSWVPLKCCIHQEPKKCKVRYMWRKLQLSNVGIDSNHWCTYRLLSTELIARKSTNLEALGMICIIELAELDIVCFCQTSFWSNIYYTEYIAFERFHLDFISLHVFVCKVVEWGFIWHHYLTKSSEEAKKMRLWG